MAQGIENIGKKDVAWSYASTIFMVGAGVILLPFILHKMPAETVGVWNIFQTITSLVLLLDFGFRPSFARNISYIFSGVRHLQVEGVEQASSDNIDWALLKSTLVAMQRFYRWIALAVLALLLTAGTAYFWFILQKYSGDHTDAMIAWVLLIAINSYNLYTLYYDALLLGKGYVKRSQQITIIGQSVYLLIAIGMIYAGFGLTAIVCAQLASILIRRRLSYRVFFTREIKAQLAQVESYDAQNVLKAIYPNAIKVGLTHLGGFLVNRSAMLMGSAFLTLEQVASYGITLQVMDVLDRVAIAMYQAYTPRLAQYRAEKDLSSLKRTYSWCVYTLIAVFIAGGAAFIGLGDWALALIKSDTTFLSTCMLCAMLLIHFLEENHVIAAGFIMADNKIPFFIPSLASGAATVFLLWLFLSVFDMGVWGMILAPGIAQLAYQNWKWPSMIIKELKNADSNGGKQGT